MPVTVPNQKLVTLKKAPCDPDNKYARINLKAMQNAMVKLSNAEFQIWMYFAKNQDNYTFALSAKDAACWNIARTTYDRTIHKFITEGYLVADRIGTNRYTFYEVPKEKGTYTPYYGDTKVEEPGQDWSY